MIFFALDCVFYFTVYGNVCMSVYFFFLSCAYFVYILAGDHMVFFSNSPANHVWAIKCTNWVTGSSHCPKANSIITLLTAPGTTFNGDTSVMFAMGLVNNMQGLVGFNTYGQTPGEYSISMTVLVVR